MNKKRTANTISIVELLRRFPNEEKATQWLEKTLWGHGPTCVHCGTQDDISSAKTKKFTYWCKSCRKHFTVKNGTVMHGSNIKAHHWVVAIYFMVTARKSISSLQLSKELGITQKSAWYMMHRIRKACEQGSFKLANEVELDATYMGGKEANKHNHKKLKAGRGTVGKQAVLGMRERGGKVKAMPVSSEDGATVRKAVNENIETGATLYTDEHKGYTGVGGVSYRHETVNHSAKEYVNGMAHTNGIESVWAVLKRGFHGTFHHFSNKHLSRYVDEFCFRLNEGNVEIDTIDRMTSVCRKMIGKRLTYRELVA